MKQYMNLHAHSHGSLLDGVSRPVEYAQRAKDLNMPAFTFTEHGNLFSLMDANDAANKVGIKYLPGIEAYQARKTRFDRDPDERAGRARSEWDQRGPYHLGLIAYNDEGYRNLIKISSRAYTEGFFVKPRVDYELLSEHSDGIVALSGCLSGAVQQAILRNDLHGALDHATKMQDIFGKDDYFIEIMDHHIPEEKSVHDALKRLAKHIDAPMVATCDSHYTMKEHAHHHDVSLCINTGAKIQEEERFKFFGDYFYLKSFEEMQELFPREYLTNTLLIAEKHDLTITSGEYHFPKFPIPSEFTEEEFFVHSVRNGAAERFGDDWEKDDKILERLEYELNVIKQLGFANYFLIVSDIVKYAKDTGCLAGPGRGSAAGSLVAFCLYITEVNPLKYNLNFERFLVYQEPQYTFNFPELV